MNWETILFLGDSLTFGARGYLGYPEYAGDILAKKTAKEWNVINHGTNGYRAIDLARSISNNFSTLATHNALLSVVLIGTNDAKTATTADEYRIALEQVIIKAKLLTLNSNVLLLKIPALAAGVSYPYSLEMNVAIDGYNQIIDSMAKKHTAKTLSIALENEHFFDGVHFNTAGTVHVAQGIADHILLERGF